MNLKDVKAFIQLAKDEGVTELKYEVKDTKIAVSFKQEAMMVSPNAYVSTSQDSNQKTETIPLAEDIFHHVTSPFVGTFYGAAGPEMDPFVKVGDKVKKGQTLCILEAMKIMNEIEADCSGEIVEICAENENLVEFGQVLFKIKD